MSVPIILTGAGDATTVNPGSALSLASPKATKPTNLTDGDLLLAVVVSQQTITTEPNVLRCNDPAWILAGPPSRTNSTKRPSGMWVMPVTNAGAVSDTNWIWQGQPSTGRWLVRIYRVTGVDLTNPIDAAADEWIGAPGGTTTATMDALTTVTPDSLVVYHLHGNNSAVQGAMNVTKPTETTFVEQINNVVSGTASSESIGVYTEARPTPGAVGSRVFTTPAIAAFDGYNIALRPLPVAASWVGGAGAYRTTSGSSTITLPAFVAGDLAILVAGTDTGTDPAFATPAGWTFRAKTAATNMYSYIFSRVLQAGDVSVSVTTTSTLTVAVGIWRDVTWGSLGTFGIRSGSIYTVTAPNHPTATGFRAHIFSDRTVYQGPSDADIIPTALTYGTGRYAYGGNPNTTASTGICAVFFCDSSSGSGNNTATLNDFSTNAWGVQLDLVTATAVTGQPKVDVAGTWTKKPAKVWTGAAWVEKPMKRYNGTAWVPLA